MSEPIPAPVKAPRKMLGMSPWLLVVCLLVIGGVAAWKGGLLGFAMERFQGPKTPALLNPNTASMEELRALPGVDEKIATDIIKKRPFATVEDIKKVKGIGDKKLEKLKPLLTFE